MNATARSRAVDGLAFALVLAAVSALLWRALGLHASDAAAALGAAGGSYVVRTVASGAIVLGVVSGVLGTLAVTRGQSLLGDVASHAALPGIYGMFVAWSLAGMGGLVVGPLVFPAARSLIVVLLGALLSALAAAALVAAVRRRTALHEDAALGVALSTFFGAGIVARSLLQSHSGAFPNRAGLEAFLYGSVATMTRQDVFFLAMLSGLVLVVVALFWKELGLLCFDPDYLATLGFRARALDALLSGLIVVTVVIGLQLVGVILMSALLIAPAVAARQWSDRLARVAGIAVVVAVAAGLVGVLASSSRDHVATGPAIAVHAACVALASVMLAPRRGVLWSALAAIARARDFATDTLLLHLTHHGRPVNDAELARQLGWPAARVARAARPALGAEWLARSDAGLVVTDAGRERAVDVLAALQPATTTAEPAR